MANLTAKRAIDTTTLDFAKLLSGKNLKFTSKQISVDYKNGERDLVKGSFSFNALSKTVSGTVKSWVRYDWKNKKTMWTLEGLSTNASKVLAAAKTKSLSDDRKIIKSMFAKADTVIGSAYADKLYTYDGNDVITPGGGADSIDGGDGRDRIVFVGPETVQVTLAGSSVVYVSLNGVATDRVRNVEDVTGGDGNDTITGDGLANRLYGGAGDDLLSGAGGKDTISGGAGNDTIIGGSSGDSLSGDSGHDLIMGGTGGDKIDGGSGNDTILGGSSGDKLYGKSGNDSIQGDSGSDLIDGGSGNDLLRGGSGNDTILGGTGLDTITGGSGKDVLTGGADADVFLFLSIGESPSMTGRDYITDFTKGLDLIDLSAIDASLTELEDQAFVLDARSTASAAVAEGHIGWYTVNKSGTKNDRTFIRINTDDDAQIEMVIELKGVVKLTAADFIL